MWEGLINDRDKKKLLPCPFCGGKAYIDWEPIPDDVGNEQVVKCSGCGVRMGHPALTQWNKRVELKEVCGAGH